MVQSRTIDGQSQVEFKGRNTNQDASFSLLGCLPTYLRFFFFFPAHIPTVHSRYILQDGDETMT